jgi:predicted nucleic acid-binding protein
MLDTNMCIYIIKKKPERVLKELQNKRKDGLAISTITLAELEYGNENSQYKEKNKIALMQFLTIIDIRRNIEELLINLVIEKKYRRKIRAGAFRRYCLAGYKPIVYKISYTSPVLQGDKGAKGKESGVFWPNSPSFGA